MKKCLYYLLLFLTFLIIPVTFVYATEGDQMESVILTKSEVVDRDYFAMGNEIQLSGTVNGDAYVAGGNVTVDGIINGDLLVAGGNVNVLGRVTGDIRAAGGNITFSSDVDKNVTMVGGSLFLSESGKIGGSLVLAGGNIAINTPVSKGATLAGGQIFLRNMIGGDVQAYSSNLSVGESAYIQGNLDYWADKEVAVNQEASISGRTTFHYAKTPQFEKQKNVTAVDQEKILGIVTTGTLLFSLYNFIVSLLLGWFLLKLLPVFTSQTILILEKRALASLGVGFLVVFLFPLLFISLLLTIIGIPLALLLMVAIGIIWFISETFVAFFIGSKILNYFNWKKDLLGWQLFVGLLLIGLLSFIPFINLLVGIFVLLIGIGALLMQSKNVYTLLRQKEHI